MKKMLPLFLAALLALSACSRQSAEAPEAQMPTSPSAAQSSALPSPAAEETAADDAGASTGDFIDLTAMSSTMVFAEVFNMTTHPEDYVGKTVKMQGIFSTGKLYAQEGTLEDGGTVLPASSRTPPPAAPREFPLTSPKAAPTLRTIRNWAPPSPSPEPSRSAPRMGWNFAGCPRQSCWMLRSETSCDTAKKRTGHPRSVRFYILARRNQRCRTAS